MDAIYVRQSIFKSDSISIETQIDDCKKLISADGNFKVYADRGYSGKNTDRPEFQKMMGDIEDGLITKVIVWKLDRISRSVADFAQMLDKFKAKNVEFVSCKEPTLNTGNSALGDAILGILMVFAQFERETIQMRVRENYYARGKQGFYLGGRGNFGYEKVETELFGKKTYMLKPVPKEAAVVQRMYEMYGDEGASLGEVLKWLHKHEITTKKANFFRKNMVTRILSNPVYVRADADVYTFLQSKGLNINNSVMDFDGSNGLFLYGETKGRPRQKYAEPDKNYVVIGLHEGLIDSALWLRVQERLSHNKNFGSKGTGTKSWLSGLVKCGYCGMAVMFKDGGRPGSKVYTICRGRIEKYCYERKKAMTAEFLEEVVSEQLLKYMKGLTTKTAKRREGFKPKINQLKSEIVKKDDEIKAFMERIPYAEGAAVQLISDKINEIAKERQKILEELNSLTVQEKAPVNGGYNVDTIIEEWDSLDLEKRKKIAKVFIKQVVITDDNVNVIFY